MGGKEKSFGAHLLFANDLLLFGRVDENMSFMLREVPNVFCKESRQKNQ